MSRSRSASPNKFPKGNTNPLTGESYSSQYFSLLGQRKALPITKCLPQILSTIKSSPVLIIEGETGSGKTTQVPQYLLEKLNLPGRIACTQPRRVAAMSIAKRVAAELDVVLGEHAGYSVRFDDCSGPLTRLKYLTDGMLLREAMNDKQLSKYSVVILDEAHERTIATDILFGLLKEILHLRNDFKVLVMSATLETQQFIDYFDGAPLFKVPGRLHPVDILYSRDSEEDYVAATIKTVIQIHAYEPEGDILVFLTGEEEIEAACKATAKECKQYGESLGTLLLLPLYSSLPPKQQQRIFCPVPAENSRGVPGRKCIIATNIAETSLTIDGIVYVVDSGLVKQKIYNPRARVDSLLVTPISKSSAKQRTGRAGRTRPGKCYRLYTLATYTALKQNQHPEILRSNLASVVLAMKAVGVHNLVDFDFMDPPTPETMMRALEVLNGIGALDEDCELTKDGELMAEFPLDPQLSCCLLKAATQHSCGEEMLTLATMLTVLSPFVRPKDQAQQADSCRAQFNQREGDHFALIVLYNEYMATGQSVTWCTHNYINPRSMAAAVDIREQLRGKMLKLQLPLVSSDSPEQLKRSLLEGYFNNVAFREKSGYYSTVKEKQVVALHPSCGLKSKPEWCVYHDFVLTSKNYIRTVSAISPEWLLQHFTLSALPESSAKTQLSRLRR